MNSFLSLNKRSLINLIDPGLINRKAEPDSPAAIPAGDSAVGRLASLDESRSASREAAFGPRFSLEKFEPKFMPESTRESSPSVLESESSASAEITDSPAFFSTDGEN